MKKIYMILAVFALLSLSLNAQTTLSKYGDAGQPKSHSMKAPNRAGAYTLLSDAIDGSKFSTGDNISPSAPWTANNVRNQSGGVLYIMNGGSLVFTVPSGYNNADFKFEFKTSTSYYSGYFTFTPSTGSAQQVTTSAASTVYECELTGLSAGNTVTITGKYGSQTYSPDFMYMYVYVASSDPTIGASPTSVSMSAIPAGTATETITVTGANLTDGITATISGADASLFSVSPASLGTSGGSLTVTYSPTAVGTHTATLTLSSTGAQDVTITINGTSKNEVTVANGTQTNNYLPIYGWWYDNLQINQMIYPSSMLTNLNGKKITSMTFYSPYLYFSGGEFTVKVGETSQASFSSAVRNTADLTATIVTDMAAPTAGGTELTITFATPYEYNGGNLLVDFEVTETGAYGSSQTSFYGITQSGGGFHSYGSSINSSTGVYGSASVDNFLPKVTFEYEDNTPRHDLGITLSEPTAVTAGENATITATVTNHGNQTESGYTVTFSDGTTTFSTQTGGTLAPGATETFTATYTTNAAGTVTITANVACTDDANTSDNSATTNLTVNAQVHDLGIALSAPVEVVGGNNATVTATVTNTGNQPMTGYTVTITDGTNTLLTQTVNEALAPGATATFTADCATTEAQVGTTVNFTANVACNGDEDATNNSATASTAVITLPPPENVVATPDNDTMSATVTWNAPSGYSETTLEWDFEEEADFNDFTTVDADGDGYNWAWHYNINDGSNLETNSGSGVIYSQSYDKPSSTVLYPNNWLISPEVPLGGTLTFYACGQDPNQYWNEVFGVYVCVGSYNGVSDFVQIAPDVTTTHDMTQYTYDLSQYQGQGYFAIVHHNVHDEFYLDVDDINYFYSVGHKPDSYNVYLDGNLVGSVNANDPLTYNFSNLTDGQHTVEISAVYPGNIESAKVPAQFTLTPKTATPTITYVVNGDNVVITATGDGAVTLTANGQTVSGNGSASITVPRTNATFSVTATATAQESGKLESDPATETITIPFLQTATPNITYVANDDNENVVITATGDGTVTLTVGGQTVSGEGSASITIPYGMTSNTVTATATAQHSGWAVSETATQQITIPAATGWIEMDGTYNNPNTLLSFEKDGEEIMLIDQFLASTLKNDHPDGYTYTLREIVNREEKSSSPVDIPVYKTSSKMNGFYTKGQVDTLDLKMGLKAQVINSEMCNDVDPDHNTLYHSLYRSDKNGAYPVIDVQHRVSQLQKYEINENNTVQYYFTEMHTSGVTPRYDHVGRENVERLDTNYVQGVQFDSLAYVPVIWTFGLYSGREDGKNNSYGSDIKREYLGGVSATITGEKSDYSSWGKWTADGVEYCVYTPVITITGMPPVTKVDNDGDVSTYVPYMYRAWCLYEGAHDFTRNSNDQLIDNGVLTAPILLDERVSTETGEILGGAWTPGMGRLPWAFGIPVSEDGSNVTFAIRFYYKKVVTEAGQGEPNSLRDGNEEEEYYIVECEGDAQSITTAINELFNGRVPVETIYYNSLGMQSNEPFDGINIVVTRYSDGTTSTTKVMR